MTEQAAKVDVSIELRNTLLEATIQKDISQDDHQLDLEENPNVVKKNHLVPLIRSHAIDSDSDVELVITDTPVFPVSSMQVNSISTSIAERNREMIKLATKQGAQRRELELQEKKAEIEELKRKRKERKEARLRKMKEDQEAAILQEMMEKKPNVTFETNSISANENPINSPDRLKIGYESDGM